MKQYLGKLANNYYPFDNHPDANYYWTAQYEGLPLFSERVYTPTEGGRWLAEEYLGPTKASGNDTVSLLLKKEGTPISARFQKWEKAYTYGVLEAGSLENKYVVIKPEIVDDLINRGLNALYLSIFKSPDKVALITSRSTEVWPPREFRWEDVTPKSPEKALEAVLGGDDAAVAPLLAGETVEVAGAAGRGSDTEASEPLTRLRIDGTDGDDVFPGTFVAEFIRGFDGEDALAGRGGDDTIRGGGGDDSIRGGGGLDSLRGGDGEDWLHGGAGDDLAVGGAGDDVVRGGRGFDGLGGGEGDDVLRGGADLDTISGDRGDDTLFGGTDGDQLFGFGGNDRILGGGGQDMLLGGNGANVLRGGADNDVLVSTGGDDTMAGGPGNDLFLVLERLGDVTVQDFTPGEDGLAFDRDVARRRDVTLEADGGDVIVTLGADDGAIRIREATVEAVEDGLLFI